MVTISIYVPTMWSLYQGSEMKRYKLALLLPNPHRLCGGGGDGGSQWLQMTAI